MNKQTSFLGNLLSLCLLVLYLASCSQETNRLESPAGENSPETAETATAISSPGEATKISPEQEVAQIEPTPERTTTPTPTPTTEANTPTEPTATQDKPASTETAIPASPPVFEPYFEDSSCSFLQMSSGGLTVRCGYLNVLENRDHPDGWVIKLPVAILKARSSNPHPDPLIYIAGGGGFNALPLLEFYAQSFGGSFSAERDLIFYNQRGAPNAIPELQCPGFERLLYNQSKNTDLTDEEKIAEKIDFLRLCREQLQDEGVELEMYSSTANAADLKDLIDVLGLEQVNIYSLSYGTNVGLALLRDHPGVVRSIILDSVYPPQVAMNSARAPNAYQAYEKLFAACMEDEACQQLYPDLGTRFYALLERLNEEPGSTMVTGWETFIDGGVFSDAIYSMLYSGNDENVPKAIYEALSDDFSRIERYIPDILNAYPPGGQDYMSEGVFYSLTCREEVPYDSLEKAQLDAEMVPNVLAEHFLTNFAGWQFSLCEVWDIEPAAPLVDQPVTSDVPTLILAGQFDPITPPEWGKATADNLSQSYFFEFPGRGHGVFDSDACAKRLGLQFIEDPYTKPTDPCAKELQDPDFK